MFGDGALVLLTRALRATGGDPARAADLVPAFLAIYEPNASRRTRTFPDVTRTLAHLVDVGFRVAVVTNKPVRAAGLIFDALDLSRFVHTVVGGDTLGRLKPDPAPLQEAMRRLDAVPKRSVMVGDMHHDVEAARAAGVGAVLATYGYAQKHPDQVGADHLINSFAELPAVLHAAASSEKWSSRISKTGPGERTRRAG